MSKKLQDLISAVAMVVVTFAVVGYALYRLAEVLP